MSSVDEVMAEIRAETARRKNIWKKMEKVGKDLQKTLAKEAKRRGVTPWPSNLASAESDNWASLLQGSSTELYIKYTYADGTISVTTRSSLDGDARTHDGYRNWKDSAPGDFARCATQFLMSVSFRDV